jgi:hypothetical protein
MAPEIDWKCPRCGGPLEQGQLRIGRGPILVEVYRRLGVPEVWICDQNSLTILVLQPNGRHASAERSHAFKGLTASETHDWVTRSQDPSDLAWLRELRRWVKEVLAPRHREQISK